MDYFSPFCIHRVHPSHRALLACYCASLIPHNRQRQPGGCLSWLVLLAETHERISFASLTSLLGERFNTDRPMPDVFPERMSPVPNWNPAIVLLCQDARPVRY